jgi:hypothetical protein
VPACSESVQILQQAFDLDTEAKYGPDVRRVIYSLAFLGCAAAPPAAPVGVSTRQPTPKADPKAEDIFDLAVVERGLAPVPPASFVSRGHAGGRFRAALLANATGSARMDDAGGSFDVGTVFLMKHSENAADSAKGPTLIMEKKAKGFDAAHGDWNYRVIDASGKMREEGALPRCYMCHDDAPHDRVFTLPRAD